MVQNVGPPCVHLMELLKNVHLCTFTCFIGFMGGKELFIYVHLLYIDVLKKEKEGLPGFFRQKFCPKAFLKLYVIYKHVCKC